jgi:hypothetical protein
LSPHHLACSRFHPRGQKQKDFLSVSQEIGVAQTEISHPLLRAKRASKEFLSTFFYSNKNFPIARLVGGLIPVARANDILILHSARVEISPGLVILSVLIYILVAVHFQSYQPKSRKTRNEPLSS